MRLLARLVVPVAVLACIGASFARYHGRGAHGPGGTVMRDAASYDRLTRIFLGSLFRSVAADIAASASPSARILEVGSGPGHLSMRMARDHGLDVTGVDLDPAMIERARENASQSLPSADRALRFIAADVAALPFEDASFDLVVSTLSMHHWSDPRAGTREIARVLRPGGRALIWDFRNGRKGFHAPTTHAANLIAEGPLLLDEARPWRWPWRFNFLQRMAFSRR